MEITRLQASNPGMFTGQGTNSWVVSSNGEAVVIDPGPMLEDHQASIREALDGSRPVAVLVTHCHLDHVESANDLAEYLGVDALGACPGPGFKPVRLLADGEVIAVGDVAIEVIATPGHTPHHVCYRAGEVLFTGDHIMGGSTVIVEHMAEYLESMARIRDLGVSVLNPGHGEPMDHPDAVIDWYVAHRLDRERQIVAALERGARTLGELVETCYEEIDPAFFPMAARSVGAHLRKLRDDGLVELPFGSSDWSSRVVFPLSTDEEDG